MIRIRCLKTHVLFAALFAAVYSPVAPAPLEARQAGSVEPLRVFLECSACDFDFVRTQIQYVNWMRDRADADLHVLMRSEATGGGGRQYTLDFIGLRRHAGKGDTLVHLAGRDDTQDVTRRGLLRALSLGLVRYVADTPVADQLMVTVAAPPAGVRAPTPAAQVRDPWNAWVFSMGMNGGANGESSRSQGNLSSSVSANRVTADWKMTFSARGSYGEQRFTFAIPGAGRDTTVVSISRNYSGNALIVRSVNAHASVGTRMGVGTSTFGNTEFFTSIEPAVEYNLFPYAESTRRQLIFSYSAGVRSQRYREETIYSRMEETRGVHSLSGTFATRQAWGNLNLGVGGSQYLHDSSLYNLSFFTGASVNVARGLSVNINGQYAMVRDQIALAKRNLSTEEVLLRQRQLATNYNYFTSVGLSYRFGSAVQNVVNPRFGSSGGGVIVMF
jgi:hypothetical protein